MGLVLNAYIFHFDDIELHQLIIILHLFFLKKNYSLQVFYSRKVVSDISTCSFIIQSLAKKQFNETPLIPKSNDLLVAQNNNSFLIFEPPRKV